MSKRIVEFEREGCKVHFYHGQEPAISMSAKQAATYRSFMTSRGVVFKERNAKLKILASMSAKERKAYIKNYGK